MSIETTVDHVVATLSRGAEVRIPFWRMGSGVDGEALLVIAAQHGNEVQGCEVVRRFREVCEERLVAGSVWLMPFANLPAVRHRRSHISLGPEQPYGDDEGHNMNRTWPGNAEGNDTERVAASIHDAVAVHCTRCLDLHSWSRFTASATLTRKDGGLCEQMAEASAIRFVQWRTHPANGGGTPCTIGALFNESDRGAITIELAPQWVIREKEVAQGLRAATNLTKLFGMIEGEMDLLDEQVCFERSSDEDKARTHDVKAPSRGLFVEAGLETSDRVEEGQYLGHLIRDDSLATVEVLAPATGYLWCYGSHRADCDVALPPQHPYTTKGDLLATVIEAR
jgi:predicted deacylase